MAMLAPLPCRERVLAHSPRHVVHPRSGRSDQNDDRPAALDQLVGLVDGPPQRLGRDDDAGAHPDQHEAPRRRLVDDLDDRCEEAHGGADGADLGRGSAPHRGAVGGRRPRWRRDHPGARRLEIVGEDADPER